ncbi:MAG: arsenate reductase ArsC [Candidatus Omnitrophica bacterium]|nr:arsenate reductase ArsC [Candidatus Omnitrophota bacterium]
MKRRRVLFICKDNSIRSQMAAAFLNTYFGDRYEAYSSGIEPLEINPYAAKVMKEIGIDLSSCRVRSIKGLEKEAFDCVITLCELTKTFPSCFPKDQKQLHKSFKDYCIPMCCDTLKKSGHCLPEIMQGYRQSQKGFPDSNVRWSEKEIINAFRNLRDEIFEWVEKEAVF